MPRLLVLGLMLTVPVVALSGCYVVSPYPYPVYAPRYPPPPSYVLPSPPAPSPSRPGGPGIPPPPPAAATPSQTCQTVTVEGHEETRVRQNGQRETVWVPTQQRQICQ